MKWFIPREHGAWAMLIVPYLIGMLATEVTLVHWFFFIGVLAFYFASAPLLTFVRQPKLLKTAVPSLFVYVLIGTIFTFPVLYLIPEIILISLFILPFFILNIVFAKLKKERLFINDLCAIIALSFLVVISYYIGSGTIEAITFILMTINIMFFTASVFHVKTLIRENGNKKFLMNSNVFHGFTVLIFVLLGMPMIALIFLISSLKAWMMPKQKRYKPVQIGLIEIANSVIFVVGIGIIF
ncbi:hypothetical protein BKP35_13665 [Anaerobacillus arseniciselenatis]|uniref:YwiC-like protein n=1 Tax=Anaerobacillus arseniciselenatis TaxID=85682 RepID=A0A1S2LEK8_9BACI|nr:YwiC-like family protein [Anaerobacillus arseniciselenatis]OIJ10157.1 hypothetical protein BKP35_13665 [Anaerobacillus arseniciselenatis]